jgi:hypothetical protein
VSTTVTRAARWRLAAGAVGLYITVALATIGLSGHRVLPLFEGVGPPAPYEWVKPPAAFAAGNITPKPASSDIAFSGGKSAAAVASTPDGQFLVNFGADAISPHNGDSHVHATITPLDPATLGTLLSGISPDGNAYRLELTYQPSGIPVSKLAGSANVIQTGPLTATAFLYSASGRTWTKLNAPPVGTSTSLGATLTGPGWYLLGTSHSLPKSSTGGRGTVVIAIMVAAGAVVLGTGVLALVRHRQSRATGSRATAGAPARPRRTSPQSQRPAPKSRGRRRR